MCAGIATYIYKNINAYILIFQIIGMCLVRAKPVGPVGIWRYL